jgi:uncharacterized protein (TIGR00661 family)
MKFLFIVQGEGRGHMTQAQVLKDILEKQGHSIEAVILGTSKRRKVPAYFFHSFQCPVYPFPSPNFTTDSEHKSIRIGATIAENLKKAPLFYRTLKQMHQCIMVHEPDSIINFYDILGGLYNMVYRPKVRFTAIGHQYLAFHPGFTFANQKNISSFLFRLLTKITCLGADTTIALSLYPLPATKTDYKQKLWPPLVKERIKKIKVREDNFFLGYAVNSGYAQEIILTAKENPGSNIEVFWDNNEMPDHYQPLPNLIFHQICEQHFIEKMASCKGFLTTAGFESIGEAMYMGKPILMVPVKGQYEQQCNALDAERAGAGKAAKNFDLMILKQYMAEQRSLQKKNRAYQDWQNSLEEHILKLVGEPPFKNKEIVH